MARISVMFSGSSGNCTYIKYGDATVLIDAGVSAKRIYEALNKNGVDIATVKGVFVTHEHIDHISGLRVFCDRYGVPVYANEPTLSAIEKAGCMPKKADAFPVEPGHTVEFSGMTVTPFLTSHDAAQSVGYKVKCHDGRTATYVTDTGTFDDGIFDAVKGSDTVVLEANHDIKMLQNSTYPYNTIMRILSDNGHLSNKAAAAAAVKLAQSGTTRIILAHLSLENNLPSIALSEVENALSAAGKINGKDFLLFAASAEDGREIVF